MIHRTPITYLLEKKYRELWGIEARELCKSENRNLVFDLSGRLAKYYQDVRRKVCDDAHKDMPKMDVSQTLITKILMGTMGCCPAYDRYFVTGIGSGVAGRRFRKTFSKDALAELAEFYVDNQVSLERVDRKTKEMKLPYPQMKILDMAFWKQGFDAENMNGIMRAR